MPHLHFCKSLLWPVNRAPCVAAPSSRSLPATGRAQWPAPCLPAGPLDGCYFTLAALRGTQQEAQARRLVQENGGRLFTETTVQRVTGQRGCWVCCAGRWGESAPLTNAVARWAASLAACPCSHSPHGYPVPRLCLTQTRARRLRCVRTAW